MSAAAIGAVATALWPTFRRVLIRLGRWVLMKLIERGAPWLLGLMRRNILRFELGIEEAKASTRAATRETGLQGKRRWRMKRRRIQRRLDRWRWAAAWIAANVSKLKPTVLKAFEQLSERIPETAPWERAA